MSFCLFFNPFFFVCPAALSPIFLELTRSCFIKKKKKRALFPPELEEETFIKMNLSLLCLVTYKKETHTSDYNGAIFKQTREAESAFVCA